MPRGLLEEYRRKDPVDQFDAWLVEHTGFTEEERNEIELELKGLLNDAVQRAEASPEPDPDDLLAGVYAPRDALDAPHFS